MVVPSLFPNDGFGEPIAKFLDDVFDDNWYGQEIFDPDNGTTESVISTPPPVPALLVPLSTTTDNRPTIPVPSQIPEEPRPRRKNKIKKGEGPDARPDPEKRDNYVYVGKAFFELLRGRIRKSPAKAVEKLCQAIHRALPHGLTKWNRWVYRREPCAYYWLDQNRELIPDALVESCIRELALGGFF
jgi:hypothetical protein